MPVFEYQCKSCDTKYEVYHKSLSSKEEVSCPECKSKESKKLFSSFSASVQAHADHSCASGKCEAPFMGGCSPGMCGLN